MTDLPSTAAASVREALRSRRLRQNDIAQIIGRSQQAMSDRLVGKTAFTLADLDRIADHLGVSVAELLEPPAVLVEEPTAVAS